MVEACVWSAILCSSIDDATAKSHINYCCLVVGRMSSLSEEESRSLHIGIVSFVLVEATCAWLVDEDKVPKREVMTSQSALAILCLCEIADPA